ncbi:MAG: T9SS type A sorting domain-containing protein, partial [bacterium]
NIFEINRDIKAPLEGSGPNVTNEQSSAIEKMFISLRMKGMPNNSISDGCLLSYSENFSNAYGREDASKMSNLDENIALVNDEIKHAILGKKSDQILSNDTTHISLWNLYEKTYTLEIDPRGMANDQKIYFVNNKNSTSTLLKNNQLFEYEFQPRAGEKTINDFSIIVGNQKGIKKNVERLLIYPNPAKDEIQFILPNHEIANWAKIFDTNGKLIIITPIKQAENKLRTSNLPKGNYLLEIKTANRSFTSMFNKL